MGDHEAIADIKLGEISEVAVAAIPAAGSEIGFKTRCAFGELLLRELGEP